MATTHGTTRPKLPKAGFWWALAIFLITAIVGIVLIVMATRVIIDAIDGAADVPVNEIQNVTVDSGDYVVFVATPTGSATRQTEVTIEDPSGNPVEVDRSGNFKGNVQSGGDNFEFVASFEADADGTYRMLIDAPAGSEARVAEAPIGRFLAFLLGGFAIGGLGFVLALIILIVTLVRRSRAKKQFAAAGTYATPPPYVPPAAGGYVPPPGGYAPPPGDPAAVPPAFDTSASSVPPPGPVPPPPPAAAPTSAPAPPPPPAAAPSTVPPPGAVPPPPPGTVSSSAPTPPPPPPSSTAPEASPPAPEPAGSTPADDTPDDQAPTPPPSSGHEPPA